jgi:O-antigen ligase
MTFERWALACVPAILLLRDVAPSLTAVFAGSAALIIAATMFGKSIKYRGSNLWLAWLAVGGFSFAVTLFYQPVSAKSIAALAMLYGFAFAMSVVLARRPTEYIVRLAGDMVMVTVVLSFMLWLMGFEPATKWAANVGYSSMMQSVGYNMIRQVFPLMGGSTSQAAIFGMGALVCLYRKGLPYKCLLLICVFGLIAADGRAAAAALVLAWIPLGRRWLALLIPLSIPAIITIFAIVPDSILIMFSRSGWAEEITNGNLRLGIWQAGFDYLFDHPFTLLFGNGFYGQSEFIGGFDSIFQQFNSGNYSMHNTGLQIWIDQGIIGLSVVTIIAFAVMSRLQGLGAAMMAYIVLVGLFDTFGTIYWDVGFIVFALLAWSILKDNEVDFSTFRSPVRRSKSSRRLHRHTSGQSV